MGTRPSARWRSTSPQRPSPISASALARSGRCCAGRSAMPLDVGIEPRTGAAEADLWLSRLNRDGYCIIRGAVAAELVAEISADLAERFERTPFCDGEFYGGHTKRFG